MVATQNKALTAGAQTFTWDGRSSSGFSSADGTYSIKVDAIDTTGSKVSVDTQLTGKVDAIDLTGSEPVLLIGDRATARLQRPQHRNRVIHMTQLGMNSDTIDPLQDILSGRD